MNRTARIMIALTLSATAAAGAFAGTNLADSPAAADVLPRTPAATATPTTTPTNTPSATPTKAPAGTPTPTVTPTKSPPSTPTSAPTPTTPQVVVLMSEDDTGDRVRELEARLAQLDRLSTRYVDGVYGTSTTKGVRSFQNSRDLPVTGSVDEETWRTLRAATQRPTEEELHPAPPEPVAAALDERCTTGNVICIDKSTRTLRWVVDGDVQLTVDARFGPASMPTREGQFSVYRMHKEHVSSEYGSQMPYSMFFSGGQAVHYSSDFAARGYNGNSHGCVNVRDRAAVAWLFSQVDIGDKVIVYRS